MDVFTPAVEPTSGRLPSQDARLGHRVRFELPEFERLDVLQSRFRRLQWYSLLMMAALFLAQKRFKFLVRLLGTTSTIYIGGMTIFIQGLLPEHLRPPEACPAWLVGLTISPDRLQKVGNINETRSLVVLRVSRALPVGRYSLVCGLSLKNINKHRTIYFSLYFRDASSAFFLIFYVSPAWQRLIPREGRHQIDALSAESR